MRRAKLGAPCQNACPLGSESHFGLRKNCPSVHNDITDLPQRVLHNTPLCTFGTNLKDSICLARDRSIDCR